jgi:hypothetical protein
MTADRQPSLQARFASQVRRVALVALLAVASSAVLSLAHGAVSHTGDCGVCSVLAHGGAKVADVAAKPDLAPVASVGRAERLEPDSAPAPVALDLSKARAPPTTSVSI